MPRAWPAFCKALGLAGILNRSGIALGEHRLASPHSRLATRPAIGALLLMAKGFEVVLISTYDLGRQPFGLASPAAWLRRAGAEVTCLDLSRESLPAERLREADFIAFHVPMHTATRLAVEVLPVVRRLNARATLGFYGLYAPVNETYLRRQGASVILGGEFEEGLLSAVHRLWHSRDRISPMDDDRAGTVSGAAEPSSGEAEPVISLARQQFLTPDRSALPPLERYAHLNHPGSQPRTVGYTEASRGCKHLCRHCPVVPVYAGHFRIVPAGIVLEDIRQQVAAGAAHVTFGDPDFFNGIGHAVPIVRALHAEHPWLTYDVTIKIEHLLRHAEHLLTLRETGCLFVTSAVESVDDRILTFLEKGHTCADFVRAAELCRSAGIVLSPTFVPFTPWTTLEGYADLLSLIAGLDLVENVTPIQLAIRLLIPAGSRLLDLTEVRGLVEEFDEAHLFYPWSHPDPRVDALAERVERTVGAGSRKGASRRALFRQVWELARDAAGLSNERLPDLPLPQARATVPYLTEPWYC